MRFGAHSPAHARRRFGAPMAPPAAAANGGKIPWGEIEEITPGAVGTIDEDTFELRLKERTFTLRVRHLANIQIRQKLLGPGV